MAVLLKNLLLRAPKMEDLVAITELVTTCDFAEYGFTDSTMGDLASNWQQSDFNLATDAWVIVTNRGQIVGFVCVWHRDYEQITTYVGVHPEYRGRGIGTLLLRLVEERARHFIHKARPGTRVTLSSSVSGVNEQAKRLFEREGYIQIRKFWRIRVGADDSSGKSSVRGDFEIDLDVDSQQLIGATQLYDRDAVYIIREYSIYEKELRAGASGQQGVNINDELEVLTVVG